MEYRRHRLASLQGDQLAPQNSELGADYDFAMAMSVTIHSLNNTKDTGIHALTAWPATLLYAVDFGQNTGRHMGCCNTVV